MFESLEYRRMLDASIDLSGNLIVDGDTVDDVITLTLVGTDIVVDIQPENFNQAFPLASITTNAIFVVADDGNDTISIASTITLNSDIAAGLGNDTVTGGGGGDNIHGSDGNDSLDGGLGADSMAGDAGIDTVTYASRTAAVSVFLDAAQNDGEAGENDVIDSCDIIIGGSGNDRLSADAIVDSVTLYGQNGNDTVVGGDNNDRLNGGQGNDDLRGFNGDDILIGGPNSDKFNGGAGTDTATYYNYTRPVTADNDGRTDDGVVADSEKDNIKADVENITGGSGADNLTGSSAANVLDGGAGADTMTGGAGTDNMLGRAGADSFFASDGEIDTIDGGADTDVSDNDLIDLVTNVP